MNPNKFSLLKNSYVKTIRSQNVWSDIMMSVRNLLSVVPISKHCDNKIKHYRKYEKFYSFPDK